MSNKLRKIIFILNQMSKKVWRELKCVGHSQHNLRKEKCFMKTLRNQTSLKKVEVKWQKIKMILFSHIKSTLKKYEDVSLNRPLVSC